MPLDSTVLHLHFVIKHGIHHGVCLSVWWRLSLAPSWPPKGCWRLCACETDEAMPHADAGRPMLLLLLGQRHPFTVWVQMYLKIRFWLCETSV